jgi:type VI secretion system protein ImpM
VDPSAPPGWYGKLPALGDFASRRLAVDVVEALDRWLAGSLDSWRGEDPQWLDVYLSAPVSRFLLGAGLPLAGGAGCAGVLMPSVDRVGRYFPLVILAPRSRPGADAPSQAWFDAIEALAVAAMQDDWDIERLDAELALLPPVDDEAPTVEWPLRGESRWWRSGDGVTSQHVAGEGLPLGPAFVALFRRHVPTDLSSDPLGFFE